jgi:hypothetical protein
MSEKEVEQKFMADFRDLFPKLKDATGLLDAPSCQSLFLPRTAFM